MKYLYLFISFLFLQNCHSQNKNQDSLYANEVVLQKNYEFFFENRYNLDTRDTILKRFRVGLLKFLKNESSKGYEFKELSKSIKILESEDKKFKIFSWDELNGGTWHTYNSAYQYIGSKVYAGSLLLDNPDKTEKPFYFTDVKYLKINDIEKNRYLVLGYGTHGQGHEFYTMRLLTFKNDKIQDCEDCFNGEDRLVLFKQRGERDIIEYNSQDKQVSYLERKEDENTGEIKLTERKIILEYNNGQFINITK